MLMFTAIGFLWKSTTEVPHNDNGSDRNGELKVEITCGVSGTKTTLIKTSHVCICPTQDLAAAMEHQAIRKVSQKSCTNFVSTCGKFSD